MADNLDGYKQGHGLENKTAAIADASAPAAFTAPATGAAKTVTTNDAADLTTVADGLEALRDEVATLTTKLNSALAALRTHGSLAS